MISITWTSQPTSHPRYGKGVSKNLLQILSYFKTKGFVNLGNFGVRPIRGGTKPSSHSFGAAQDLGYGNLTRAQVVTWIDFIIAHAEVLGVQELHDYAGLRVWMYARRNEGATPGGWKAQARGSHGGGMNPSSRWIHIETSVDSFDDATPVEQRLAGAQAPAAVQAPAASPATEGTFMNLPTIAKGDVSMNTALLQNILRDVAGQPIGLSDGKFGAQTEQGLKNLQAWLGLPMTGVCDERVWIELAKLSPASFGLSPATPEPPAKNDASAIAATQPTLRRGDKSMSVALAQNVLREKAGQDIGKSDGDFGAKTETAVRNLQAWTKVDVTGVIDQVLWQILAGLDPQAFTG